MDAKFTEALRKWLASAPEDRDLQAGADLLLRLNRNRWLHQQILRRRNFEKLEYELRKHLTIRERGFTIDAAAAFERQTLKKAVDTVRSGSAKFSGKRADHDSLPDDIRAIPEANAQRWHRIKELFESLKLREREQPCDRHEDVFQLAQLDDLLHSEWERYDHWTSGSAPTATAQLQPASAAQVAAARKFLSTNLKKLANASSEEDAAKLRSKMQQRINLILAAGEGFKPDFSAELERLGLTFAQ